MSFNNAVLFENIFKIPIFTMFTVYSFIEKEMYLHGYCIFRNVCTYLLLQFLDKNVRFVIARFQEMQHTKAIKLKM